MMTQNLESLVVKGESGTFYVPDVHFDVETGHCLLSGESYLENTWDFYNNLLDWLRSFAASGRPIKFDFRLKYFNTSSSKGILQLLEFLKSYQEKGGQIEIHWYYRADDEDLLEEAEDFIEDTKLDICLHPE